MNEEAEALRKLAKIFFELDELTEEVYRLVYENVKNGPSKQHVLKHLERIADSCRQLGAGVDHLDLRKPEPIKHRKRPEGQWQYLEQ